MLRDLEFRCLRFRDLGCRGLRFRAPGARCPGIRDYGKEVLHMKRLASPKQRTIEL